MIFDGSFKDLVFKILYIFLLWKLTRLIYWFYKCFFRKRLDLKNRYGYNSWVLITGATDGIGKGFAESFAKEGFNIILVSRSLSKLQTVESELKIINPNIKIHLIVFDFVENKQLENYLEKFSVLENFDISIIVNNVGGGTSSVLEKMEIKEVYDVLNLNVLPQTLITKIFIERLAKREKRSAIVNISSASATKPFTYFALYSSTKIYNDYFARALNEEYKNKIDCMSVRPCLVESLLTKLKANKDGFFVISRQDCSESSLDHLGYESMTYGHWKHELQGALLEIVGQSTINLVAKHRINTKKRIEEEYKKNN